MAAAFVGAASVACGSEPAPPEAADPEPGSLLSEPLGELPVALSKVGLYRDAADRERVSRRALFYEPSFPLWSDGGEKQRFLVLPEASTIDGSSREAYEFPTGTLLFKTFSFRTPASPDSAQPIETRLLRLTEGGWEFAAYAWNEQGTDAELLELTRSQPTAVLSDDGAELEHRIPSRLECRQCHESASTPVLGLNELQLAGTSQLEQLAEHVAPAPAAPFAGLGEHGPLTRAALGYFVGNCTHCHNGGSGAASSFDLRPETALNNVIDVPTQSSATAAGIRVLPGAPEASILYLALSGSEALEVKAMPPVGVALRDSAGGQTIFDWISALGSEQDP